ncbi:MAG TPA: isoprenylcysteine carboxylmethyltransferase family protein [Solirubrobacteraceae bacterium]|nr:isoprenylcysteine carboxylmethyltransferase family protein [Solirubrobacteraceae bacterium]
MTRLPALGKRGEGWVLGQALLMTGVFLSALVGRGWSGGWAVAAYLVGGTLLSLGVLLLGSAALQLGGSLTPLPAPRGGQELVTTGAFGLVRHPMYGGGILIGLGWAILFATVIGLALAAVLAIFLALKAHREEVWLRQRLPGYEAYRERTPRMLVPFVY